MKQQLLMQMKEKEDLKKQEQEIAKQEDEYWNQVFWKNAELQAIKNRISTQNQINSGEIPEDVKKQLEKAWNIQGTIQEF